MCQSPLVKSDILLVAESDGNEEEPKKIDASAALAKLNSSPSGNLSSKVKALMEDLTAIKEKNAVSGETPIKSVIFSQWTQMLDLLEV